MFYSNRLNGIDWVKKKSNNITREKNIRHNNIDTTYKYILLSVFFQLNRFFFFAYLAQKLKDDNKRVEKKKERKSHQRSVDWFILNDVDLSLLISFFVFRFYLLDSFIWYIYTEEEQQVCDTGS